MMRDYREKRVHGLLSNGFHNHECAVDVRMTSDDLGATLSLTVNNQIQIAIVLDECSDIIKVSDRKEYDHGKE